MSYNYHDEKYLTSIESKVGDIIKYISDLCVDIPKGSKFSFPLIGKGILSVQLLVYVQQDDVEINLFYDEQFSNVWDLLDRVRKDIEVYNFPLVNLGYKKLVDSKGNFETNILSNYTRDTYLIINIYKEMYQHLILSWHEPYLETELSFKDYITYELKYKDSTQFLDNFKV